MSMDEDYDEDDIDEVVITVGMMGFDCLRCEGENTVAWRIIHYECACGMSYNQIYDVYPYGDDGFVTKSEALTALDDKFDITWDQIPASPSCTLFITPPSGTTSKGVVNE